MYGMGVDLEIAVLECSIKTSGNFLLNLREFLPNIKDSMVFTLAHIHWFAYYLLLTYTHMYSYSFSTQSKIIKLLTQALGVYFLSE